MRWLRFSSVSLVVLAGVGLAACGGASRTAAPNELGDLESLQRELALREAELQAQLPTPHEALANADTPAPATGSTEAMPKEEPSPAPIAPAPAPAAAAPRDDDERDQAEKKSEADSVASSPCELMCRALGSMRRSATGICSLTSASDERCVSAQQRVETAARQVTSAGCACQP